MLNSTANPIILLGASVRAAGQSARRAKLNVIGVDQFHDVDSAEACQKFYRIAGVSDCRRLAHSIEPSNLIVCGGVSDDWVDEFRQRHCLLGPSRQTRSMLNDTGMLSDLARQASVLFPTTQQDFPNRSGRWLSKQPDKSGGLGVMWACETQRGQSRVYQSWVEGKRFGATFMGFGCRAALLGVCRSLHTRIGNRPFVYAGSYGPVTINSETKRQLTMLGREVVSQFSLYGLFNIDFVVDRYRQLWLLEINPRWSGSSELIERALAPAVASAEFSLFDLHYRCLSRNQSQLDSICGALRDGCPTDRRWIKKIIFATHDGVFIDDSNEDIETRTRFADIPRDGTRLVRGSPVMTVISEWIGPQHKIQLRADAKRIQRLIKPAATPDER